MEELYRLIEERIRSSGYPGPVDGETFYDEVSAEADEHENGTYLFLIKKTDTDFYQGCMEILDDAFDLKYVDIHENGRVYNVDF